MTIPEFNKRGSLEKGIHRCTSEEFIKRFCYGENTLRAKYKEIIEQLLAFSISRDGKSIIFGGSFITSKEEPNDLDCMLVLPNESCCMLQSNELLTIEGCELDVLVVAETNKETIYNFLNLFSVNKLNLDAGLVEIVIDQINDKSTWDDYEEYSSVESLFKAREAYINRHVIKAVTEKKIFITVLELNKYLIFNHHISPIISSSGWIFAPYVYLGENIIGDYNGFKAWINYIDSVYDAEISVFADGIGALLLGMYLKDDLKYRKAYFNKIVLSKALLTPDFDWCEEFKSNRVQRVCNLKSVQEISGIETVSKEVTAHKLFGKAYKSGFSFKDEQIIELPYSYNEDIDWEEFQNNIFPIFHMSYLIQKNVEKDFWLRMAEIANDNVEQNELLSRDILK